MNKIALSHADFIHYTHIFCAGSVFLEHPVFSAIASFFQFLYWSCADVESRNKFHRCREEGCRPTLLDKSKIKGRATNITMVEFMQ